MGSWYLLSLDLHYFCKREKNRKKNSVKKINHKLGKYMKAIIV